MTKKLNNKSEESEVLQQEDPKSKIIPKEDSVEDITVEDLKKGKEEDDLLKDALNESPESLTDEQKELIRKNSETLPDEYKEFYKDVLEKPTESESKEEEPELKKKLSASAKENQKIYAKNRIINKALAEAEDIPEPTEQQLQAEFKDWDIMSETEKVFAKETVVSRQWRQAISKAKEQTTKIEKWSDSVDEFVDDPATFIDNPGLEGKTNEFKEFATQEENNSVPMKILVSAFLHDNSSGRTPNKGRMFEKGSGGPNNKPQPKNDKLTIEEARRLRDTDYNKWKEMLKAGKIESTA